MQTSFSAFCLECGVGMGSWGVDTTKIYCCVEMLENKYKIEKQQKLALGRQARSSGFW